MNCAFLYFLFFNCRKKMKVIKRNGSHQDVHFDKITKRLASLQNRGTPLQIDPVIVAQKIVTQIHSEIKTSQLDELASEIAIGMVTKHPDYGTLAARIVVSNLHKSTSDDIVEVVTKLNNASLVSDEYLDLVKKYSDEISKKINYECDFSYDYFGMKTLERSYLLKIGNEIVERPQHMIMRVCFGIHGNDIDNVMTSYDLMSKKYFTHATPTLFNASTRNPQLSSCFLLATQEDSISGIYDTIKNTALISKWAGGIGLHVSNIRSKNSLIKSSGGLTRGIIPLCKVLNETAKYVNQSGKRAGSFAIYLEPWHADIFDFLHIRNNHGNEDARARELFTALWIPDLFMKRVKQGGTWSLMSPDISPGLAECHGAEFDALYEKYESEGKFTKQVNAQDLWFAILVAQTETGTPYLLFKDAANAKSNQKNLGTIKSSNLCSEIILYSDEDETAVCNLASISLPAFINNDSSYNFAKLADVTKVVTANLDKVIDVNFYPTPEARRSNFRHRPIGIGVQGLADVFMRLALPFESDAAKKLNRQIFETIYFASCSKSVELAREKGKYESFEGSPASKGILQFDMWNAEPCSELGHDWESMKDNVVKYGLRNSTLLAQMPTASTASILGNIESIEPALSNIFSRRTVAGEFTQVNRYLVEKLVGLNLWNDAMKDDIIINDGSIQAIESIPDDIKKVFKTAWEISMKNIIDMSAERGAFICQSQSLNLFISKPSFKILSSMYFYAWESGLKTGVYYLRTRPRASAVKVTTSVKQPPVTKQDDDACVMCSG